MFSYSTGYYVSPPDDQYLKFKNRCSLVYRLKRVESHWLTNRYLITYGTDSDLTRKVGRGRIVNSSLE
jgi:hypothetical protein